MEDYRDTHGTDNERKIDMVKYSTQLVCGNANPHLLAYPEAIANAEKTHVTMFLHQIEEAERYGAGSRTRLNYIIRSD